MRTRLPARRDQQAACARSLVLCMPKLTGPASRSRSPAPPAGRWPSRSKRAPRRQARPCARSSFVSTGRAAARRPARDRARRGGPPAAGGRSSNRRPPRAGRRSRRSFHCARRRGAAPRRMRPPLATPGRPIRALSLPFKQGRAHSRPQDLHTGAISRPPPRGPSRSGPSGARGLGAPRHAPRPRLVGAAARAAQT